MKKLFLLFSFSSLIVVSNAQSVGIGTNSPNASAQLDIASTTKGLLIPRMATTQRVAIPSPAKGLMVFDNNTSSYWYYNGSTWTEIADAVADASGWKVKDNSIYYNNTGNVGIGIDSPVNRLHLVGNLVVSTPLAPYNNGEPTPAETLTLINGTSVSPGPGTFTARLFDPGGPSGNYLSNLNATANLTTPLSPLGWEVTLEFADIKAGDSLIIKGAGSPDYLVAVGNGYSTTQKWILNAGSLSILFKSNNDGINGAGFSLLCRALKDDSYSYPDVSGIFGKALVFNTKTGALLSGYGNSSGNSYGSCAIGAYNKTTGDAAIAMGYSNLASGGYSVAIGYDTKAIGQGSTAFGLATEASGYLSTALGVRSKATGSYSTAAGYETIAGGDYSSALGYLTVTAGNYAIALGNHTTAAGTATTAMGSYVSTAGHSGCLVIGDNSTTSVMTATTDNSFKARFDGGYRFYTSAAAITSESCLLAAGSNAWSTTSDVRTKENFAAVDGEGFLKKISSLQLTSWNYKKQDPNKFRHYGPMAQDFYAAFGKDSYGTIGNDTTINQADFDGVNFIAIQALEKRTQKIAAMEKENEELKILLLQLRKEIDELKTNFIKDK